MGLVGVRLAAAARIDLKHATILRKRLGSEQFLSNRLQSADERDLVEARETQPMERLHRKHNR
jgi:hypothetical protein